MSGNDPASSGLINMAVDMTLSSLPPFASSSIVFIGVITAVTYGFLWAILHLTQDPNEPKPVLTGLPFLSPLIEIQRWSFLFFTRIKLVLSYLPNYHDQF